MVFVELMKQVLRALDGAGDQLRIEHHIERVDAEVPLRLLLAAVDLDHITEALKGMKGEPDGKNDMCDGKALRISQ